MKKILLLLFICLSFLLQLEAQIVVRPSNDISAQDALVLVKEKYPEQGANYYLVDQDADANFWNIFVDPTPQANWGHDCYTCRIPKTASSALASRLIVKTNYTFPPEGDYSALEVKSTLPAKKVHAKVSSYGNSNAGVSQSPITYALIISGGKNEDQNYIRYWNDCAYIYTVLNLRYGIDKSRIFPIMANGPQSVYNQGSYDKPDLIIPGDDLDDDGMDETILPATKENIANQISALSSKLRENDHLFIYVMDHGGLNGNTSYICLWQTEQNSQDYKLYDYELAAMLQPFVDKKVNINAVFGQCYAGGFNDNLSSLGCVVAAACTGSEYSWSKDNDYDEFVYHWTSAINGFDHEGNIVNADTNNDGHISMDEAFAYAKQNDMRPEHPQYLSTPQSIGEDLAFDKVPDLFNLYIRDNAEDTGRQPNASSDILWNSPDIWLHQYNNGSTTHEPIDLTSSQKKYTINTNISNRGIHDYTSGEYLHLYWSDNSCTSTVRTWIGEEYYDNTPVGGRIASVPIPAIAAQGGVTVPVEWELPDEILNCGQETFDVNILARITHGGENFGNTPFSPFYTHFVEPWNDRGMAQKSVSIINPLQYVRECKTLIRNAADTVRKCGIELDLSKDSNQGLLSRAFVKLTLSDRLLSRWTKGGSVQSGFSHNSSQPNTFTVSSFPASLNGIVLQPNDLEEVKISVIYKLPDSNCTQYSFDLKQTNEDGSTLGGTTFSIQYLAIAVGPPIITSYQDDGTYSLELDNQQSVDRVMWLDSKGDIIGNENRIVVTPSTDSSEYTAIASDYNGDMLISNCTLTSDIGINSYATNGNNVTIRFNGIVGYNSRLDISGITNSTNSMSVPLETGINQKGIDIYSLPAGWYVISLIQDNTVIDRIKFNKK